MLHHVILVEAFLSERRARLDDVTVRRDHEARVPRRIRREPRPGPRERP